MNENINIFDIDNCILPSCFPNLTEPQNREQLIRDILEKSKNIELFPAFIEYYKIFCKKSTSIFITGRQESEFKELTEKQLEPLKKINKYFTIIYYPENRSHNPEEYFIWKINSIKSFVSKVNIKYLIFDDLTDYFDFLKDWFRSLKYPRDCPLNYDVSYFKIDSNDGWLELIL